jgi:YggT family protein
MFVFSNFLVALARIADIILTVMYWLILIRALISWVNPDPYNPIVRFLYGATEPILQPLRRFMPAMAIDFSPLVAFLIIVFLKYFLVQSLIDLAMQLKQW